MLERLSGAMDQDQISGLLVFVFIAVSILALRIRVRNKKRLVITDFRRGVHFVGGKFKRVLGPGSYTFDTRKEQILVMDLRPQPILIERFAFQDVLRHEGIISIATELLVREPHLASTALRDQIKDSIAMVRESLRQTMSGQVAGGFASGDAVSAAIKTDVNAALEKVGMGVSEIEVTELWMPVHAEQSFAAPESIQ